MPFEGGTFISDLNASNPVGSTDKVQTLDDHVRLLKSTIKATFPNVAGAVTPTHTELSYVDGVTSAIQTQLDAKAAANALNASNLTSGTVPDARFPATLPAVSGVNLTNLAAAALTGSIADARLSSNVALENVSNAFSAAQSITVADGSIGLDVKGATGQLRLLGYSGDGAFIQARNAAGSAYTALHIEAASIAVTGAVVPDNVAATEFGYHGLPRRTVSSASPLVAADCGKYLYITTAGANVTVPSTLFDGFACTLINNSGGNITLIEGSGVDIYLAGTGLATQGNRTLADGGVVFLITLGSAANFIVSGNVS